jgi:hypothetical protein
VDQLVEQTYNVRLTEECPTCKIKAKAEAKPTMPEVEEPQAPSLNEYGKNVSEKRRQFLEEMTHGS